MFSPFSAVENHLECDGEVSWAGCCDGITEDGWCWWTSLVSENSGRSSLV